MARKNDFRTLMLLFAVFAFLAGAGGCGGGGGSDPAPAETVTTDSPAALVGAIDSGNPLLASFEDRLTSKASSLADAAVIVLSGGSAIDEAAGQLEAAYDRGAIIAVLEPTLADMNELSDLTGAHLSAANDNGDKRFCDIYAFVDSDTTGFHTYVLGEREGRYDDVPKPADGVSAAKPLADVESEDEIEMEEVKPDIPSAPSSLSEEERKMILNHFIEWINNEGPKDMESRQPKINAAARGADTTDDVLALVKAQTVTFNNSVPAPWPLGGFQPIGLYTDTYFIYAIHDNGASNDVKYDYYIFDQECDVISGNMYKGLYTTSDWGSYTHIMAFYLYDYYTDHYLQDSSGAFLNNTRQNILQTSPTTTTGSSTYTTSSSWTIGGSLGFNGDSPTGSVSASMTYSQSHTTSIPDITMAAQSGQPVSSIVGSNNNARWTYSVGNLPKSKYQGSGFYPHKSTITPEPPAIATSTATFYNTWIWRVSDPSGTYKVLCRSLPRYASSECRAHWPYFSYTDNAKLEDKYLNDKVWTQERTITLIAPPRS